SKTLSVPVSSGTPSARSSALSRSNLRWNASCARGSAGSCSYPGTVAAICAAVRNRRVDSRQITRLTRRSVRARDTRKTVAPSVRVCGKPHGPTTLGRVGNVRWRSGAVTQRGKQWRGAVELTVRLDRRSPDDPPTVRALAYPDLVGEPVPGDRVLLNTNALALGL